MKTTPDMDLPLVRRARAGDFSAFEELVERHERRLYALAMGILRQREDAENVVQTTFLKVLENLRAFREESSFGTWVTKIASHAALSALRKRKGLPTVPLSATNGDREEGSIPHPQLIADWRDDPAKIVEDNELRGLLLDAIDELPEKHRLVFLLRDVEGLSVRETAQVLGISDANVKVRLLRARLALREKLTHVFGDVARAVTRSHEHDGQEEGATPAERLLKAYQPDEDQVSP